MSTTTQHITAEQLLAMPSDGSRYELMKGELRQKSPGNAEHGATIMRIAVPLGVHVMNHDLGIVFGAETGFMLTRKPDTVLAPDVAYIRRERIPPSGLPRTFWEGAQTSS